MKVPMMRRQCHEGRLHQEGTRRGVGRRPALATGGEVVMTDEHGAAADLVAEVVNR
jgi:hypothetical protein